MGVIFFLVLIEDTYKLGSGRAFGIQAYVE